MSTKANASAKTNFDFNLNGRVALVTGASSGLGLHFSGVLAAAGAKIALAARREDRLQDAVAELKDAGHEAIAIPMDVTDSASVAKALDIIEAKFGQIEICVNNAGLAEEIWFTKMTDEDWRRTMDVNLDGVFRVGREVASRMKKNGTKGSIINIASMLGDVVRPMVSAYCVSKAAVIQLTKAMALELTRSNIRVNALAPGYFSTELNREFLESELGAAMIERIPMQRPGNYDELNAPLLLLASDVGSYMTGSILTVDGGALLSAG